MRLSVWLEQTIRPDGTRWTQGEFGQAVGEVGQQTVSKWVLGLVIPRPHHMDAIKRVTRGQVTERDFYEAHAERRRRRQQQHGARQHAQPTA